nr:RNA-directed DNA polymerase, eukaryota [Tanacetum cinerariifolium]
LKINLHKSKLYGVGVPMQDIENRVVITECSSATIPFKYLGLPMRNNMNRSSNWENLIQKVKKKLGTWKICKNLLGMVLELDSRWTYGHDQASKGSKSSCDGCQISKSWITCVNTNGNTKLSKAQEVSLRITSGVRVHISRLNPFGCTKLTTFVVMCKTYGCEPSVDLFQGFFNLCREWLNFSKRSEKHVSNLLPKAITHIEGWHERFFYVQDSIIPAKYSQLLSEQNKLDSKSFKDKLPLNIEENPMRYRELLQVSEKLSGECDVMSSRERAREEECEGLRVNCEAAMPEFEKNPAVVADSVPFNTYT